MDGVEGVEHLDGDAGRAPGREHDPVSDQMVEGLSLDELERHEQEPVVLAEREHRREAGMLEAREELPLADEALLELVVPAGVPGEDLEGDLAIELQVDGAVDGPHAALSEQLHDAKDAAEGLTA